MSEAVDRALSENHALIAAILDHNAAGRQVPAVALLERLQTNLEFVAAVADHGLPVHPTPLPLPSTLPNPVQSNVLPPLQPFPPLRPPHPPDPSSAMPSAVAGHPIPAPLAQPQPFAPPLSQPLAQPIVQPVTQASSAQPLQHPQPFSHLPFSQPPLTQLTAAPISATSTATTPPPPIMRPHSTVGMSIGPTSAAQLAPNPDAASPHTLASPQMASYYWAPDEHARFEDAMRLYGSTGRSGKPDFKAIATHVGTRTPAQVRNHFLKTQHQLVTSLPPLTNTPPAPPPPPSENR